MTGVCADLAGQGGDDGLGVDQGGVAQVVEAVRAEDLSAGLEPDGLAEGDAVLGEQLWGHAAQGSEHGPASVDDLDLAVAAHNYTQYISSHALKKNQAVSQ